MSEEITGRCFLCNFALDDHDWLGNCNFALDDHDWLGNLAVCINGRRRKEMTNRASPGREAGIAKPS